MDNLDFGTAREFLWLSMFWIWATFLRLRHWTNSASALVCSAGCALGAFLAVSCFLFSLTRQPLEGMTWKDGKHVLDWYTGFALSTYLGAKHYVATSAWAQRFIRPAPPLSTRSE